MPSLRSFMARRGKMYKVERDGFCIDECEGILSRDGKGMLYCGFFPNAAVRSGDWLIDTAGNRYHVEKADISMVRKRPFILKAYISTEGKDRPNSGKGAHSKPKACQTDSVPVVASCEGCILIMRERVFGSESEDKDELLQVVNLLDAALKGHISLQRGTLSRFSTAIERNPWISAHILTFLFYWIQSPDE